MTFLGKVSNGTVVLPQDANLPDGTPVRVEPLPIEPLAERLKNVIGTAKGLPGDLAGNHDHYIHRTPKK